MKAKQYFEKYRNDIVNASEEEAKEAINRLVLELVDESKEMIKVRRARKNTALAAIIRELGQKYNAICDMFEKNYGASPLIRDGFLNYWKDAVPELKKYL